MAVQMTIFEPRVDFYLTSFLQEVSKDTRYVFVESLMENVPPKNQ